MILVVKSRRRNIIHLIPPPQTSDRRLEQSFPLLSCLWLKTNYMLSKAIECSLSRSLVVRKGKGFSLFRLLFGVVSGLFHLVRTCYDLFRFVPLFTSDNVTECCDLQIYYNSTSKPKSVQTLANSFDKSIYLVLLGCIRGFHHYSRAGLTMLMLKTDIFNVHMSIDSPMMIFWQLIC